MNNRIPLIPLCGGLLIVAVVTACSNGGHSSADDSPPPRQEHKLHKVSSAAELETYLKNGLKTAADSNGVIDSVQPTTPTAVPTADAAANPVTGNSDAPDTDASFSNTTLIEEGVDEADTVKADGDLIFVAAPANAGCIELCPPIYALAEDAPSTDIAVGEPNPSGSQNRVRVMRTDDIAHSAAEIASIDIPYSAEHDYQSLTGLLLAGEDNAKQLVAVSSASSFVYQNSMPVPDQWSSIWAWSYGSTIVDTFDVSNASSISHQHRIELDGYLLEMRRINNTLYVVTRFTPEVSITGTAKSRKAQIDTLSLAQLLPKVSIDGNSSALVSSDNCFVDAETNGYPTLMVVTAINLGDSSLRSSCVTANTYSFYMSKDALYLTQSEWAQDNSQTTHIYKFSISENGPEYRGEGSVEGAPTANYNFTINEHDSVLRIATTKRDAAWIPTNQLYTLSEMASGDLQTLATLPNAQHPESIGKPGELIEGIRFVGDRAYVVTFLQTDPLYVIDLSDPANPFVAGQVEISGFSSLLQPLGNDLLLGIGRENNNELKVELYDVADPSAPRSVGKYVMSDTGGDYSYSTATWDHHALALLPVNDGVRFALPFVSYGYAGGYSERQGAISFSVDLLNRGMTKVAQADATSDAFIYGNQRVLLQPNSLHYIQGSKVWSGLWGSSDTLTNPQ